METKKEQTNIKQIYRRKWVIMTLKCIKVSQWWTPSSYTQMSGHMAKGGWSDTNVCDTSDSGEVVGGQRLKLFGSFHSVLCMQASSWGKEAWGKMFM